MSYDTTSDKHQRLQLSVAVSNLEHIPQGRRSIRTNAVSVKEDARLRAVAGESVGNLSDSFVPNDLIRKIGFGSSIIEQARQIALVQADTGRHFSHIPSCSSCCSVTDPPYNWQGYVVKNQ